MAFFCPLPFLLCCILLQPLDCVKTVQQLSGVERMSLFEYVVAFLLARVRIKVRTHNSLVFNVLIILLTFTTYSAGRLVVQSDGVFGLYRGLGVSLLGSIPSVGMYFFLYEVGTTTASMCLSLVLCVLCSHLTVSVMN